MSVLFVRTALPVVTAIVSTAFLVTAVPRDLVPELAPPPEATMSLASAEVQHCVAGGRDTDACLDEADGKALVERAEGLAGDDLFRRASR